MPKIINRRNMRWFTVWMWAIIAGLNLGAFIGAIPSGRIGDIITWTNLLIGLVSLLNTRLTYIANKEQDKFDAQFAELYRKIQEQLDGIEVVRQTLADVSKEGTGEQKE